MPIYEYQCQQCGSRFEALVSLSAERAGEAQVACDRCHGDQVEKQFSTFAVAGAATPECPAQGAGLCGGGGCGAGQPGMCHAGSN